MDDLDGPIFIISNSSEPPSSVHAYEDSHKIALLPLPTDSTPMNAEPEQVSQVFVCRRLPTSTSSISIKSAFDRYIGCDKFGVVSCEKEAIGPQEEWEPIFRDDGIAFKSSAYDKFLSVDGKDLRADTTTITFHSIFRIKCQASNKRKKKKAKIEATKINVAALEVEQM